MKANKINSTRKLIDTENKIGNTDISNISDGTVMGAIKELSDNYIATGSDEEGNMNMADKINAIYNALYGEVKIDYNSLYTLSAATTTSGTNSSVQITQSLPKGKYIGSWSSFWSSDGIIRAVNNGVKAGVSITKTKDSTTVEKIDAANSSLVIVDITEDSDTITLSDTNNYYRAAAAFWIKIN